MARSTILVIDDDKHLTEIIQEYLESLGYTVYTALDGHQVQSLAVTRKPGLIIMDVDMPVLSGLQALDKLRADPKTEAIPVIFLTGVVSGNIIPILKNKTRVSHIKKPLSLDDLGSMVRVYIPDNL